ncbi:MAG: ABC transporter substrate-binding protein [Desulfobacteraceae bacterium]|nr:ABC transporter substrate-binding protein [Desulfobacteraceae bacterium]
MLQATTGGAAGIGTEQTRSVELATAKRGNRLLGHPVELQKENSLCSSEGGTNAALKVVTRPETVAILGTTCSGSAVPASRIMSEAGMVMVSGMNSAPSLTAIDGKRGENWQPGYFRTMAGDAGFGQSAAQFVVKELGITKAATIDDGDPYTRGLAEFFRKTFSKLGGRVVLSAVINKGDTDMEPVLTAVADAGAELIFIPLFQPEADFIVRQARQMSGLENIGMVATMTIVQDTFIQSVGTDGIGMYFAVPFSIKCTEKKELVAAYTSRFGEPPQTILYGYAYDAANLLFNAIEAVGVLEKDGTLHIGRQALRDALYTTVDFEGVTGTLSCDEFGDCGIARFKILRLDDPASGLKGLEANVIRTYTSE